MVHVKKLLAAMIISAFTLGGIGCSGDKEKKTETKTETKTEVKTEVKTETKTTEKKTS